MTRCSDELMSLLKFAVEKGRNVIPGAADLPDEENMLYVLSNLIDSDAVKLSHDENNEPIFVLDPRIGNNVVQLFDDRSAAESSRTQKASDVATESTGLASVSRARADEKECGVSKVADCVPDDLAQRLKKATKCLERFLREQHPDASEEKVSTLAHIGQEFINVEIRRGGVRGKKARRKLDAMIQTYGHDDGEDEEKACDESP
jgi:hypothetical protein